jgi:hypothetical protein
MNADQEKIQNLTTDDHGLNGLGGFGKTKLPPLIFTNEH